MDLQRKLEDADEQGIPLLLGQEFPETHAGLLAGTGYTFSYRGSPIACPPAALWRGRYHDFLALRPEAVKGCHSQSFTASALAHSRLLPSHLSLPLLSLLPPDGLR